MKRTHRACVTLAGTLAALLAAGCDTGPKAQKETTTKAGTRIDAPPDILAPYRGSVERARGVDAVVQPRRTLEAQESPPQGTPGSDR